MKRIALGVTFLIAVMLAVCGANLKEPVQKSSNMVTLPFKIKKPEPKSDAQKPEDNAAIAAQKLRDEYRSRLDTLFDNDTVFSSAFTLFQKELPMAIDKGEAERLFSEFFSSTAFYNGKEGVQRTILKKYIKAAQAEKNDAVRMLYSQYCPSFRISDNYYRQFYVEKTVLRPGEKLSLYRYDYYGSKRAGRGYEVMIARLSLDSLLKPLGFKIIRRDTVRIGSEEHRYQHTMDSAGLFRITLSGEDLFQELFVQVSWIDCVVKIDPKTMLVFGSSYRDTLPPPYTVHCVASTGETFRTATDSAGLCALGHELGNEGAPTVKVILEKKGQLAFMEGYFPVGRPDTVLEYYLYTDRPIYRPGHTVHFRGIAKFFVNESVFLPAAIDSFECSIQDPEGTEVYKRMLSVDRYGHFGDSITLSPTQKQGVYYFQYRGLRYTGGESRSVQMNQYRYYSFAVEAYKKPEFTIKVKPAKDVVLENEEAVYTATGEYYFGGPLADVPVTVRWYQQPMYHYFSAWEGNRCCFWPQGERQLMDQQSLRFDAQGKLTLRHRASKGNNYGFLIAEVIAVDQSRREVREEAQVKMVRSDAYLAIMMDKYEYEIGEEAGLEVVAVDLKGAPLQVLVAIKLTKGHKELQAWSLKPNAEGRVHAVYTIKEAGTYRIEAAVKDSRGTEVTSDAEFRCVKKRGWDWDWERVEVTADRKEYSVGDTARITVKAGAADARALLTVEGRRLWTYTVRRFSDHLITYAIPIRPEMGYNLHFSTVFSGRNAFARQDLPIVIIDSSLLVKVSLDGRRTLEPGAKFESRLTLTDRSGKPVRANFSVALVDEAIYDVAKNFEENAGYRGRYYYWYGYDQSARGVLSLLPVYYNNRVPSRYAEFAPKYLAALMGIAEAALQERQVEQAIDNLEAAKEAPPAMRSAASPVLGAMSEKKAAKRKGVADEVERDKDISAEKKPQEPPRERKEFKDLGYWDPSVTTDEQGRAHLGFTMPDDLTKWRLVIVGSAGERWLVDFKDSLVTRQNVMVKLEAPRSFVAGDSCLVASVIHNYAKKDLKAKVQFSLKDNTGRARLAGPAEQTLTIKSNETVRADWPMIIEMQGKITFYTAVYTDSGSDAESRTYPVLTHGIPKSVSASGILGGKKLQETVSLPKPDDYAPGSRTMTIDYSLSLAGSLFEGMEYLTGYPYGCVEQTMSRFLPNLLVASSMKKIGMRNDSLTKNLPLYTAKGLERLKQLHHSDGGWGWWENDRTDPRMTALVVRGLSLALGTELDSKSERLAGEMLEAGCQSVIAQLTQQKEPDVRVNLVNSLLYTKHLSDIENMVLSLYGKREKLSPYSCAMLLECLQKLGKNNESAAIVALLEKSSVSSGDAVSWPGSTSYEWYSQDEETTARVLRALLNVNPDHPLLPKAVTWLSRFKKNGYWVSTKTTAVVIEALACYVERTNELDPDFTGTISLNGRLLKHYTASRASLAAWKGTIVLDDSLIGSSNDITFAIKGKGRLYYGVSLRYATAEKPIKAHENGFSLSRTYTRIVYARNPKNDDWEVKREPFKGKLMTGDEIEVSIKVKNTKNYEHLLLEDYFPSGMEVLKKPQDWYSRWCGWWYWGYTHSEARDDRMVYFLDYVPAGERVFTYLLRAETPGNFSALPARAELMYQPSIGGNSGETSVEIGEKR